MKVETGRSYTYRYNDFEALVEYLGTFSHQLCRKHIFHINIVFSGNKSAINNTISLNKVQLKHIYEEQNYIELITDI